MKCVNNACLINCTLNIAALLERYFAPVVTLFSRFWLANIFWTSGLLALKNWQGRLWLYENEYHVPLISAKFAAYMGTAFELICPILLVLGLATRLGALGILGIIFMIEISYMHVEEHTYWAIIACVLLANGGGVISFDNFIYKKIKLIKY